jgi:hypothetical protein
VEVVASFPADAQAAETVQPGDRALDHATEDVEAGAVWPASFGDDRADATFPEQPTVLVVGTQPRSARSASGLRRGRRASRNDGAHCLEQL